MEGLTHNFLLFIEDWGYFAVALLMAAENACIPIPSELILGFAGYLVFAGKMTLTGSTVAGMIGGMAGSIFAYYVGVAGGRPFIDKYGKYFFIKKSHIDLAQSWFDKYGYKAVFFSRLLPVVRTFISLPAGFARMNFTKFLILTFVGSLPWTVFIIGCGMALGESWELLMAIGHQASLIFVIVSVIIVAFMYYRWKRDQKKA